MKGKIINIIRRKGYLFIKGDDQVSRFALARNLADCLNYDDLEVGQEVEFTPYEDTRNKQNGQRAKDIHEGVCQC
jgi:cold shock CspA family protein